MIFIMSSAVLGQYDVIMHKLNDGNYRVTYNKHVVETSDKDEAVNEYVSCVSHAMTCDGILSDNKTVSVGPAPTPSEYD